MGVGVGVGVGAHVPIVSVVVSVGAGVTGAGVDVPPTSRCAAAWKRLVSAATVCSVHVRIALSASGSRAASAAIKRR